MDAIFKALNDPSRRALLDALRREDGQTLSRLVEQLDMTRFGVAKHLGLLEDAHLITTVRIGRFKYHYLNAVPLQELIDRWIEPLLAAPAARGMIDLKTQLEKDHVMPDDLKPDLVLHTYIRCTRDALWDALTLAESRARYHFAAKTVEGDLHAPGDAVVMTRPDGGPMLREEVIELTPKSRIEMTFEPGWIPDAPKSRTVMLLSDTPAGMQLTIEHYGLTTGMEGVNEGWARILSGLKTWLETGDAVRFPAEAAE